MHSKKVTAPPLRTFWLAFQMPANLPSPSCTHEKQFRHFGCFINYAKKQIADYPNKSIGNIKERNLHQETTMQDLKRIKIALLEFVFRLKRFIKMSGF